MRRMVADAAIEVYRTTMGRRNVVGFLSSGRFSFPRFRDHYAGGLDQLLLAAGLAVSRHHAAPGRRQRFYPAASAQVVAAHRLRPLIWPDAPGTPLYQVLY